MVCFGSVARSSMTDNVCSVKFAGVNGLMLAAHICSIEIFDFLLQKGCDPSQRDMRGYVSFRADGWKRSIHYHLDGMFSTLPVFPSTKSAAYS